MIVWRDDVRARSHLTVAHPSDCGSTAASLHQTRTTLVQSGTALVQARSRHANIARNLADRTFSFTL
jgi:hypothetical protein